MCGIFCILSESKVSCEYLLNKLKLFEKSIGRRGPNCLKTDYLELLDCSILFASSVLWLQGKEIVEQPLQSDKAIFIYNGDLFNSFSLSFSNTFTNDLGDTIVFFDILENTNDVGVVQDLEGPYAFIYFNKLKQKLYFGRDRYGRRSLLLGKHNNEIIITSVAKKNTVYKFIELPCAGVFCVDINTKVWQIFPWKKRNKNFSVKIKELETFLDKEICIEGINFEEPKPFVPPDQTQLKLLESIVNISSQDLFNKFCSEPPFSSQVVRLGDLLEQSVKKRILTQPKFCQNCLNKSSECNHAITGVLFSGGVDCAILALLAHKFIDDTRPIDLINVAFEKNGNFNTPDRLTGISTLKELQTLHPQRKWNLIQVNVGTEELNLCRNTTISDLIYPLNSILDDSLGCALWFASRGATENYVSPCRTLLVGMGADELFGGYTRHRAALQKGNWLTLHNVLEEDWQNLPYRNLARDDRVVSDHGRQLRTPYLDEQVVKFVQGLNCWERTIPSKEIPQGIGEKILLRCLAYHLGLKNAATFKKRALQFGSRIANSKEKGHYVSSRLK